MHVSLMLVRGNSESTTITPTAITDLTLDNANLQFFLLKQIRNAANDLYLIQGKPILAVHIHLCFGKISMHPFPPKMLRCPNVRENSKCEAACGLAPFLLLCSSKDEYYFSHGIISKKWGNRMKKITNKHELKGKVGIKRKNH